MHILCQGSSTIDLYIQSTALWNYSNGDKAFSVLCICVFTCCWCLTLCQAARLSCRLPCPVIAEVVVLVRAPVSPLLCIPCCQTDIRQSWRLYPIPLIYLKFTENMKTNALLRIIYCTYVWICELDSLVHKGPHPSSMMCRIDLNRKSWKHALAANPLGYLGHAASG